MKSILLNNKGLTLAELIIALGLSSLLLIFIISGSLFMKRYLFIWKNENRLYEELRLINSELSDKLQKANRIELFADSLSVRVDTTMFVYNWATNQLIRNTHIITPNYLSNIELNVRKIPLLNSADSIILDENRSGLYKIHIAIQDNYGQKDSLITIIKNNYVYYKN